MTTRASVPDGYRLISATESLLFRECEHEERVSAYGMVKITGGKWHEEPFLACPLCNTYWPVEPLPHRGETWVDRLRVEDDRDALYLGVSEEVWAEHEKLRELGGAP